MLQLAGELRRRRIPALIWYPDTPAARVAEVLAAADASAAALCWEPGGSGFRGCGMAATGEAWQGPSPGSAVRSWR